MFLLARKLYTKGSLYLVSVTLWVLLTQNPKEFPIECGIVCTTFDVEEFFTYDNDIIATRKV